MISFSLLVLCFLLMSDLQAMWGSTGLGANSKYPPGCLRACVCVFAQSRGLQPLLILYPKKWLSFRAIEKKIICYPGKEYFLNLFFDATPY